MNKKNVLILLGGVLCWFGNYNRIPEPGARLLVDDIHFTERIVQEGVQ